MRQQATPRARRGLTIALTAAAIAASSAVAVAAFRDSGTQVQIPTTAQDFFQPGTQPDPTSTTLNAIIPSQNCTFCHSDYSPTFAPFDTWVASMMGQSARDPIWHATLAIANQDAHGSGEFCIRCHAPGAWLGGRSSSGTLQDFNYEDFDGINCHFCHRAVNPELGPDSAIGYAEEQNGVMQDPDPDPEVLSPLAAAGLIPQGHGNARFIIDPKDVRRGPFSDVPINFHGQSFNGERVWLITSPFHSKSEFCGTCHDVSNPVFTKNAAGQYQLNALNAPHPTQLPSDMFPEQRTYSEWKNSDFATTGVTFADGRFGGALTGPMKSCQDCHMPDQVGGGCVFWDTGDPFFTRYNMPAHSFAGSNTWVIDAIADQAGVDAEYLGLTPDRVQAAKARNIQMLRDASDMEVSQLGGNLKVRVINQSGHKLPSGYPEGRRMWINVRFLDGQGNLVAERGAYNLGAATLQSGDTKVYEAKHGIDAAVAAATGLPEGENFHLALANKKFKDNRIPPRGFTNAAFAADGCGPVNYSYADGQHWDDTLYAIPQGASQAVVTLYYQTTSREYIEFLRDQNVTDGTGILAHSLWAQFGKSAPVDMDTATIPLAPANPADLNGDGVVNGADLGVMLAGWNSAGPTDLNQDGTTNGADLGILLANWG
jgi:hypothetical protein